MSKFVLVICDGMGDLPIASFGNQTPLEKAETPNMDFLSKKGINGIIYVLGKGVRPNSDEAHLTLFGYNLETDYPGRGPIEAAGLGIKLEEGDIAIRGNLATVDEKLRVLDRRAGRIGNSSDFVNELNGMEIDGVRFVVKPGTGHRLAIVMKGKGLSDKISNSDVHYVTEDKVVSDWENRIANEIEALDGSQEAQFTARVLEEFLKRSHRILERNQLNQKRKEQNLPKGNYILTRGPGYFKALPGFESKYGLKAACVAGAGLYKGLGRIAGMDIIEAKGATGMPDTDLSSKVEAAKNALNNHDFVFLHIKATDIFGENGDCEGKKAFIEKIDQSFSDLKNLEAAIAITADHSTPCSLKDHSEDPVPLLIYKKGLEADPVEKFGERYTKDGKLGEIEGKDFMKLFLSFK
jgi:2,3-bisphosphoglycerate-independent phosphoglycerate mutase